VSDHEDSGRNRRARAAALAALAAALAPAPAGAQLVGWQAGAVLDVAATSRALALGQRDQGLGLGHSDAMAFGPLGRHAEARFAVAVHTHERRLEAHLEEAWIQSVSLPAGLQVRAGRFPSQIGYLNEQHPHADDFVERPLLYRAFLGGHWFDDGLRVNWTAPTALYLRLGAEVFRGRQLVEEAASAKRPGAFVLSAKTGGDLGLSHSWQAGAGWLLNRREAAVEDEEDGGSHEGHGHDHDHAHAHGAAFSGRRMFLADLVWKWAPDGNARRQQLKFVVEHARITEPNRYARPGDLHQGTTVGVVWRFRQDWELGVRSDWLQVRIPHGDHFHAGELREHVAMVAWKPTHTQALRLQYTTQRDARGIEGAASRAVQLQYVLGVGAHPAHAF
jgi:hypothetical protein